eukprot:238335-Pyramimonas_sp.AAC.1
MWPGNGVLGTESVGIHRKLWESKKVLGSPRIPGILPASAQTPSGESRCSLFTPLEPYQFS